MNYYYDLDTLCSALAVILFFGGFVGGVILNIFENPFSKLSNVLSWCKNKLSEYEIFYKLLQHKLFRKKFLGEIFNHNTFSYLMMVIGIVMATINFIATQTPWIPFKILQEIF